MFGAVGCSGGVDRKIAWSGLIEIPTRTHASLERKKECLVHAEKGNYEMKTRMLIAAIFLATFPYVAIAKLCPDGTYVSGNKCKLAPDGTYVGGDRAKLCPDGTYVGGGKCKLVPDGSYVGGSKKTKLCPDGTYVSGTRCKLQPDGSYTGE